MRGSRSCRLQGVSCQVFCSPRCRLGRFSMCGRVRRGVRHLYAYRWPCRRFLGSFPVKKRVFSSSFKPMMIMLFQSTSLFVQFLLQLFESLLQSTRICRRDRHGVRYRWGTGLWLPSPSPCSPLCFPVVRVERFSLPALPAARWCSSAGHSGPWTAFRCSSAVVARKRAARRSLRLVVVQPHRSCQFGDALAFQGRLTEGTDFSTRWLSQ